MRRILYILPLLCAMLQGDTASAQAIVFTATAQPERIGVKDQLQLTYSIENVADLESLEPAASKDFTVVAGPMDSRESSYVMSGGKSTQRNTFSRTYVLQPTRTGKLTLPAGVARTTGGRTYRSNAPEVMVEKGSLLPQRPQRAPARDPFADPFFNDPFFQSPFGTPPPPPDPPTRKTWAPQPGRDLLIRASVSNPTPFVGEAVTVTYKLYSRVTVQGALTRVPQVAGAWTEEVPVEKPRPTDEALNGQPYRSVLLKQVIVYPQQTGALVLPPAEMQGYAQPPGELYASADPFFDGGGLGGTPVKLRSEPVRLAVKALPAAGKPVNFSGAVGNFRISAALDKGAVSTDERASFTITLRGRGAGKLVKVPGVQWPDGLSAYDPQVRDSLLPDGSGLKTVRYALSAQKEGLYRIPPVSFSYLDAGDGQYKTVATQPAELRITQGSPASTFLAGRSAGKQGGWGEKSFLALGVAAAAGTGVYLLMRRKRMALPVPAKTALQAQPAVQALPATMPQVVPAADIEAAATHAEVLSLFREELSLALQLPARSATKAGVLRALDEQGVPASVQEAVHEVWQQCEAALYAPGGIGHDANVRQTAHSAALALDKIRLKLAA